MQTSEHPAVTATKERAKEDLQIWEQFLPKGAIKLGQVLEFHARKKGYENWRAYKAVLEKTPPIVEDVLSPDHPGIWPIMDRSRQESLEKYRESVQALLEVERMGSGASETAAQVLLSAYNGSEFHLDVTDLGGLDSENMAYALRVMWGRAQSPWMEPHQVIEDGEKIFHQLWGSWEKSLHVQNRWKTLCSRCQGRGWVYRTEDDADQDIRTECSTCVGRGRIPEVSWPGQDIE